MQAIVCGQRWENGGERRGLQTESIIIRRCLMSEIPLFNYPRWIFNKIFNVHLWGRLGTSWRSRFSLKMHALNRKLPTKHQNFNRILLLLLLQSRNKIFKTHRPRSKRYTITIEFPLYISCLHVPWSKTNLTGVGQCYNTIYIHK